MKFIKYLTSAVLLVLYSSSNVNASLSSSERSKLLDLHNKYRNELNSPNMKVLSWDSSLAKSAQNHANTCVFEHSQSMENLSMGTNADVEALFKGWVDEKNDFLKSGQRSNFKSTSYNGKLIGHYTQVVWAENSKVGCGLHTCNQKKNYLVCHYEIGNVLGREVYKAGSSSGSSSKKTTTKKIITTQKKTTTKKITTKKTTTKKTTTKKTTTKIITTKKINEIPTNVSTPNKNSNNQSINKNTNINNPVSNTIVPSTNSNNIGSPTMTNQPINPVVPTNLPMNNTTLSNYNMTNPSPSPKINSFINENTIKEENNKIDNSSSSTTTTTPITDIDAETDSEASSNAATAGFALGGSVLGAAALFAFYKTNPNQYKKMTDSIKRGATSIKRGATTIKRGATTSLRRGATFVSRKAPKRFNSTSTSSVPSVPSVPSNNNYTLNIVQ